MTENTAIERLKRPLTRRKLTGLPSRNSASCQQCQKEHQPLPEWMKDELIEHTQAVWSKAYQRPVSMGEAIEILVNMKRFVEMIIAAKEPRGGVGK